MPSDPTPPFELPTDRLSIAVNAAASVLAACLGITAHEGAHMRGGWLAGGTPTLWTATEVLGGYRTLSAGGYVVRGS